MQATNIIDFSNTCSSSSTYGKNCIDSTEQDAAWNYGANFGGPTKSTWTSGANSITMGTSASYSGKGMFGKYAVTTDNYNYYEGGLGGDHEIKMCGGGEAIDDSDQYGKTFCKG